MIEGGFVDNRFLAVSVEWARVFLSTVARGLLLRSQNLSIVGLDHIFHVPRAAVGQFQYTYICINSLYLYLNEMY